MKKKSLAIILTLTMILGLGTIALAGSGDPLGSGTATITFEPGTIDPVDPGGIDPAWGIAHNVNLYFGSNHQVGPGGRFPSYGLPVNQDVNTGRYAGYAVVSGIAGTWDVTADLVQFVNSGNPTMAGATLELVRADPRVTTPAPDLTNPPEATTYTRTLSASTDPYPQTVFQGSGIGAFGANWTGYLNVIAGTMLAGYSTSTMTWTLNNTP